MKVDTRWWTVAALTAVFAGVPSNGFGQSPDVSGSSASVATTGRPGSGISDVAFLAGCWAGEMGSLDMREQWTEADGGVMLGTTRYFRDGVLADFEFAMLIEQDGRPVLWPYPRGERSEHGFPLERIEGTEYVFENLEHDFPVRIIYVRDGDDRLAPRIEGSDGEGPGWTLERTRCPG